MGNLAFCGAGRCDKAYVWPVHDGDVGTAARLPAFADALLPRDLDGDSSTTEAYYYVTQDITWLADSNLGLTNNFGLLQGSFSQGDTEVSENGLLFAESLPGYLSAINQSDYLGINNWRLPVAATDDPGCLRDASLLNAELEGSIVFVADCRSPEVGEFNQFLLANTSGLQDSPFPNLSSQSRVWLGSNGPTGRHSFFFGMTDRGEVGNLAVCPTTNGTRDCQPAAVWLVHDGDIGTGPQPETGGETTSGNGGGSIGMFSLLFVLYLRCFIHRRLPSVSTRKPFGVPF